MGHYIDARRWTRESLYYEYCRTDKRVLSRTRADQSFFFFFFNLPKTNKTRWYNIMRKQIFCPVAVVFAWQRPWGIDSAVKSSRDGAVANRLPQSRHPLRPRRVSRTLVNPRGRIHLDGQCTGNHHECILPAPRHVTRIYIYTYIWWRMYIYALYV